MAFYHEKIQIRGKRLPSTDTRVIVRKDDRHTNVAPSGLELISRSGALPRIFSSEFAYTRPKRKSFWKRLFRIP